MFQPVIPSTGLTGWLYLERTYDSQIEAFSKGAQLKRDLDYFKENIGSITNAADLVADRRLREVALGAFGLLDDLDSVYFVQRILEDGTADDDALANRLADDRYAKFSDAFGLDPGGVPLTLSATAMEDVAQRYLLQSFELEVGAQDDTMRIALYARRELAELAGESTSEQTKWFSVLGQPPLRSLFETALGLPASFGQVDVDQQVEVFRDRSSDLLGTDAIAQFSDPDMIDKLITTYHARAQIAAFSGAGSSAATALVLLQSATIG